ncbi:MAG: hypothetical protein QN123_14390 [Armatimonadota bacterium]|nr:hypothetical protein [Armatimonadota bacterium]
MQPAEAVLRWSDLATWERLLGARRFPTRADRVVVSAGQPPLMLDVDDAEIGRLEVHSGFLTDPTRAVRLRVFGNLIQHHGRFAPQGTWELHWPAVDETTFVGGHTEVPLETDPGLWLMECDVDMAGEAVVPWALAAGDLVAGQEWITLDRDPVGWRVGGEVMIAPTLPVDRPPDINGDQPWQRAYDVATIAAVSGRQVRLSVPLQWNHPRCGPFRDGTYETAEVVYLSRTGRITGTLTGRAHVIVMSHDPGVQRVAIRVDSVELRYLGPQQLDSRSRPSGVLGRYGLHLHMLEDKARGATIRAVVARDLGNPAFVPHASHGTTWDGCVAHMVHRRPGFWWDHSAGVQDGDRNMSHDTLWVRCVASRTFNAPGADSRLTGFDLPRGLNNAAVDCRVFGVRGGKDTSGLLWPEGESDDVTRTGVWRVEGLVSHNNPWGTFNWQNTGNLHVVLQRSRIYRCWVGIGNGAYANPYQYEGFEIKEVPWPIQEIAVGPIRWRDAVIDVQGAWVGVHVSHHVFAPDQPAVYERVRFVGPLGQLQWRHPENRMLPPRPCLFFFDWPETETEFTWRRVVECEIVDNLWQHLAWFTDTCHPRCQLEVIDWRGHLILRRRDQPGDYYEPLWNASVTRVG